MKKNWALRSFILTINKQFLLKQTALFRIISVIQQFYLTTSTITASSLYRIHPLINKNYIFFGHAIKFAYLQLNIQKIINRWNQIS
jgi:hypothetical protein